MEESGAGSVQIIYGSGRNTVTGPKDPDLDLNPNTVKRLTQKKISYHSLQF
jgi:hypothetical protein